MSRHITKQFSSIAAFAVGVAALLFFALPVSVEAYGKTSTYLSKPYWGDNKQATQALYDFPEDMVMSSTGAIIVADTYNYAIRRVNTGGKSKTLAGNGSFGNKNGKAKKKARFSYPMGVDMDDAGTIYIADRDAGKIRRLKGSRVTQLVKNVDDPTDVAVYGDRVYFLESGTGKLFRVSTDGGSATKVAGGFSDPRHLAVTDDGKYVYVTDADRHQLMRVRVATGDKEVVAGVQGESGSKDGSLSAAKFDRIRGVTIADDNTLYVADGTTISGSVRTITLTNENGVKGSELAGSVSTFVSDATENELISVGMVEVYNGYLYALSTGTGSIRKYNLNDPLDHSLVAGANRFNVKKKKPALVGHPKFLAKAPGSKWVYVSENNRIRRFKLGKKKRDRVLQVVAGSVIDNYNKKDSKVYKRGKARFSDIPSFAITNNGKTLYVVDRNNNRIRKVKTKYGKVSYLTGAGHINVDADDSNDYADGVACPDERDTGVSGCAYFNRPTGSALSVDEQYLYVADSGNNRIRRVTVKGSDKGRVVTIAGSGDAGFKNGTGTAAKFDAPVGLAMDPDGDYLYVADRDNNVIRRIRLSDNVVTTLAGTGQSGYLDARLDEAVFSLPEWLAIDGDDHLYVSEVGSQRIRLVDLDLEVTKLVAGSGDRGYKNGKRKKAQFNNPRGMLPLSKQLLVTELRNDTIRSIDTRGGAPFSQDAPTIGEVVPDDIGKEWFSGSTASLQVTGSGFRHGATGKIGGYDLVNVYVQSATSIVIEVPITRMGAGYHDLKIQNTDGQYDSRSRALAVSENAVIPNTHYTLK